jgi:hypothetical protein
MRACCPSKCLPWMSMQIMFIRARAAVVHCPFLPVNCQPRLLPLPTLTAVTQNHSVGSYTVDSCWFQRNAHLGTIRDTQRGIKLPLLLPDSVQRGASGTHRHPISHPLSHGCLRRCHRRSTPGLERRSTISSLAILSSSLKSATSMTP